ncbi:MAG: hypothetical protein JSR58_07130 [Verrucomicrobia bacterium]|nr:hypothetical protein [Verrucomicrobiota bacterium]
MQPTHSCYRKFDYLLTTACKGECSPEDKSTIDHFWDQVEENPAFMQEMRKEHQTVLEEAYYQAHHDSHFLNNRYYRDEEERKKIFIFFFRDYLKVPISPKNPRLQPYLRLRAKLIHSTYFKTMTAEEIGYGRPPYKPYEALLAKLWKPCESRTFEEEVKMLERFIKKAQQPDNII